MKFVTVLIVDDHEIVRQGLINLLSGEEWIHVVGEAGNGRDAIRMVQTLKPQVTVMDIGMPDLNGIEASKQILKDYSTKIIALTIHNNLQYIQQMMKIGVTGYLLKDCAVDELIDAIKSVSENQYYLSKAITNRFTSLENYPEESILKEFLSDREKEVLQLIAEGNSTSVIAGKLFVSAKTVETHRKHIMEKLNMYSIPELTKYALKTGLTQLD